MKIEFNIVKATVIVGRGPDKISLKTDKTEYTYPYSGSLFINFDAAAETGATLLYDLYGIEAEVVRV